MKEFKITLQEIKEICEYSELLNDVKTEEDVFKAFNEKTLKGMYLKDIIETVGYNKIPTEKSERIEWIRNNVSITGLDKTNVPDETIDDEPDDIPDAPEEPDLISEIDLNSAVTFFSKLSDDLLIKDNTLDTTNVKIFEGISVEYQDNFCLMYKDDIYEKFVAVLKPTEKTVVASGYLQRDRNEFHIILKNDSIKYDLINGNGKFRLALFDKKDSSVFESGTLKSSDGLNFKGTVRTVEFSVEYKPMETVSNVLCIDFGTSNTSVGTYGVLNNQNTDIELVPFVDVTSSEMNQTYIYPTIVYVEDCSDKSNIKYSFGYEAQKKLKENHYESKASVFFEIKRWVGTLDQKEDIYDATPEENTASVTRREIVKAYLMHVINIAQQHFKVKFEKIHMSAPVKLKKKFSCEFTDILKEEGYKLLQPENSVDEGIAIVYNNISKLMENSEIENDKEQSIMILDCGGGTTDLASCKVKTRDILEGKKLEIRTTFENGNSNYGGNNITYRIMQLIKIKLASQYSSDIISTSDPKELVADENEILGIIENENISGSCNAETYQKLYGKFDGEYSKAEQVIPTVFKDNPKYRFQNDIRKIQRNYYYLWQFAERIKVKFYEEDLVQMDFEHSNDKVLTSETDDNYFLYIEKGNGMEKIDKPAENLEITINEIRRILSGDIYGLLFQMLDPDNSDIDRYDYYKLSGQSCKISLFLELLKEFIPGRKLRSHSGSQQDDNHGSIKLKLDCIRGSIAYVRDKEFGSIKPEMKTEKPKMIYDVFINKVGTKKQVLFKDDPDKIDYEYYSMKASKTEFSIINSRGKTERKPFVIELGSLAELKTLPDITLEDLFEKIKKECSTDKEILDDIKKRISDENVNEQEEQLLRIVLALPSEEGYGINIYRINKSKDGDKEIYRCFKTLYENYEDESTNSYFDGRR